MWIFRLYLLETVIGSCTDVKRGITAHFEDFIVAPGHAVESVRLTSVDGRTGMRARDPPSSYYGESRTR